MHGIILLEKTNKWAKKPIETVKILKNERTSLIERIKIINQAKLNKKKQFKDDFKLFALQSNNKLLKNACNDFSNGKIS